MSLYLPLVKPHLVLAVQVGAEACLPWESRSGKTTAGVDLVLRVIFLRERPAAGGLPCRRRRLGGRGGERGGREPAEGEALPPDRRDLRRDGGNWRAQQREEQEEEGIDEVGRERERGEGPSCN